MSNHEKSPPLVPESITEAHRKISKYIHRTPVLSSEIINAIASSPNPKKCLARGTAKTGGNAPRTCPKLNLFFKCENFQNTGAFKARGAFHAVIRLIEDLGLESLKAKGVITVSSGNHAQGLALAAATFGVPAIIVMPKASPSSKIEGVMLHLDIDELQDGGGTGSNGRIIFCENSNVDKLAALKKASEDSGAIVVPPYEHPDIILGQGTCAKELEEQFRERFDEDTDRALNAVVAPIGGGGLLGGIATWFDKEPSSKKTKVFGAEPSFNGADDAARGLQAGERITTVSSFTIADGLRTPVGALNWTIVSNPQKVQGVFAVGEEEIKMAMCLLYEKLKIVVEPSACVPLAAVLFNQDFREEIARLQLESGDSQWDIGIVLSGGNTTMSAISKLFADS